MEEFPGDNPANLPEHESHFHLPRSPAKVLDDLRHNFRVRLVLEDVCSTAIDSMLTSTQVGINGFGSLGRAVFCKAYKLICTACLIWKVTDT